MSVLSNKLLSDVWKKIKGGLIYDKRTSKKILYELQEVGPEQLEGEARKLFEAIMKIADERDKLKEELDLKNKIINLMSEQFAGLIIFDIDKDAPLILYDKEEVKQYFENKAKEK